MKSITPPLCAQLLPGWKLLRGQRPPLPLCNSICAHLAAPPSPAQDPSIRFAPLRRDVSNCITSGVSNAPLVRPCTSAPSKQTNLLFGRLSQQRHFGTHVRNHPTLSSRLGGLTRCKLTLLTRKRDGWKEPPRSGSGRTGLGSHGAGPVSSKGQSTLPPRRNSNAR